MKAYAYEHKEKAIHVSYGGPDGDDAVEHKGTWARDNRKTDMEKINKQQ